jgi:uncharacterized membrane-anchored protein YhcB (DUF1043 family)
LQFQVKKEEMKLTRIALVFLAVIITLGSCTTRETQRRKAHNKELRAEMDKYSNILDTVSSKIYLEGAGYNF